MTFGERPVLVQDFATLENLKIPHLTAAGRTPMSEAILRGLQLLAERKRIYKANRISYYRPWIFLLTDGAPTDPNLWPSAVEQVRRSRRANEELMLLPSAWSSAMKKLAGL